MKFYVYILRRPDKSDPFDPERGQPFYIGKGCGRRVNRHRTNASKTKDISGRKDIKNSIIHYLWNNGLDYVEELYASGMTEDNAHILECELIKKYGRKDIHTGILANQTDGGEGMSGHKYSEEYRKKMHLNPWPKGKPVPLERKLKISAALKGRKRSPEHCRKLSESQKGKIVSEESRRKMSEAKKGKPCSEETRKKLSESNKGRKCSEETLIFLRKMGLARRGCPLSTEHRQKLSKAKIGNKNALGHVMSPEAREKSSLSHKKYHEGRRNGHKEGETICREDD